MSYVQSIKQSVAKAAIVACLWIIVALLISSMTFIMVIRDGYPLNAVEIVTFEILCISPWFVCTPLIIWVARKYRLEKRCLYLSLPAHLLAALFIFSFHSMVQSYQVTIYFDHVFEWSYVMRDFMGFLDLRLMLYTVAVLAVYGVDFKRRNRESKLKEPRLRAQLDKARYQHILNQIQPAFLLNSIDCIREKIKANPDGSEHVLTDFSDLLRIMLQNAHRTDVSIHEEIETFVVYTRLLEGRLEREIDVSTDIQEDCYEIKVPSFLMLIPLFEQLIPFYEKKSVGIKSISYNVKKRGDNVLFETVIKGLEAPLALSLYRRRNLVTDIKQHLDEMFEETVDLTLKPFKDTIRMSLIIPFKNRSSENVDDVAYLTNQITAS